MFEYLCSLNELLCQFSNVLVVILVLTVLTFIISIYTCFVKCRKMQKNIDRANKNVCIFSQSIESSQRQVSECLKEIENKIECLEAKLDLQ